MSLSLIINFASEYEQKVSNFVLSSLSIILNTNANVVTRLNPFNSVNNVFSLFAYSVFLSCSSRLKEFEILTL